MRTELIKDLNRIYYREIAQSAQKKRGNFTSEKNCHCSGISNWDLDIISQNDDPRNNTMYFSIKEGVKN